MNLFGTFNYGRLIKTFLPGLILFVALCLYMDIILKYSISNYRFLSYVQNNPVLFSVILIPFSIILGIFSNTFFFTFATHYLINKHHISNNNGFYDFKSKHIDRISRSIGSKIGLKDDMLEEFISNIDVSAFLLNKTDVSKIAHIKDSYWYYLEFHLNILFAIDFIVPALMILWLKWCVAISLNTATLIGTLVLYGLFIVLLNILFIVSARKNYFIYKKKRLSLLIGAHYYYKS